MKPDRDGTSELRLVKLKARTLLIAIAAMLSAVGAIKLGVAALARMALGQARVPGTLDATMGSIASVPMVALSQAALAFVVLAILLFSITPLGRRQVVAVLVGGLFLCAVTALASAPTARILRVFPSQLEWAMMLGRFDHAERLLEAAGHSAEKNYVKAQIDMRAGDAAALRISAPRVLTLSDDAHDPAQAGRKDTRISIPPRLVPQVREALMTDPNAALAKYGEAAVRAVDPDQQWGSPFAPVKAGSVNDYDAFVTALTFEPAVIHALDVALNGTPRTRVGTLWEIQHRRSRAPLTSAGTSARAAAALALLLLSAGLALLWNAMRSRVWAIHRKLTFTD